MHQPFVTRIPKLARAGSGIETELKFLGPDLEAVRETLRAAGATLESPRGLEDNVVFDDPKGRLGASGRLLRLRDGHELTVKLPLEDAGFKTRREITYHVTEPGIEELLAGLDLLPAFRYQKFREGWDLDGMWVTLDELPFIGTVVEIEGERDRILATAERIGLGGRPSSTDNYRGLYQKWARRHGIEPGDLTFEAERAQPRG